MTFEDIEKWLKNEVERLVDHVHPERGDRAACPAGGEYEEWAIGVRSEDPQHLFARARVLLESIRRYYCVGLESIVLPFGMNQIISYPPPLGVQHTLYWRIYPEASVPEEKCGKSHIYMRFTIR